jgi:hypothetical protein
MNIMKTDHRVVGEAPQTDLLLAHFKTKPSISAVEAWSLYSIRSLSRRIVDLRERGYQFSAQDCTAPNSQRYVRYHYLGFQGLPSKVAA